MTKGSITADRVLDLIAAYGAERGGWPEEEREAATAFIAAQPDLFSDALSQARMLDAALAAEIAPEPGPALADKILSSAPKARVSRVKENRRGWLSALLPGGLRGPVGAVAGSLAIGLATGYAYASTATVYDYDDMDSAYGAVFEDSSLDMWEVTGMSDG